MKSLGTVYAVTGNHDACPVNSFPPAVIDTDISSDWVYGNLSTDWEAWVGAPAADQVVSNYGSYSYVHSNGLRIISVNTNFWYKQNFWLYEKDLEHDPSGMFAWLVSELQAAEDAGQRVWLMGKATTEGQTTCTPFQMLTSQFLAGHMPMGASDAFHDASYYFGIVLVLPLRHFQY